jgi:hypothetical protein
MPDVIMGLWLQGSSVVAGGFRVTTFALNTAIRMVPGGQQQQQQQQFIYENLPWWSENSGKWHILLTYCKPYSESQK